MRTADRLLTEELHFDYVIRFRGNITVTAANGETRTAAISMCSVAKAAS